MHTIWAAKEVFWLLLPLKIVDSKIGSLCETVIQKNADESTLSGIVDLLQQTMTFIHTDSMVSTTFYYMSRSR